MEEGLERKPELESGKKEEASSQEKKEPGSQEEKGQPIRDKVFGGIQEEFSNFKKAKAVILQVPYEKTATYKGGTKNGPAAIIDASCNVELFDDELNQDTYRIGIHTMDRLDVGELSPEDMVEKVRTATLEILKAGKLPVALGGEHTLTVGAVKGCKEIFDDLTVLQLDAHCDLRDEYRGSKYSHACVARRLVEICPVVQTGTRSLSREGKEFLDSIRKNTAKESDKESGKEAGQGNDKASSSLQIKNISVYDILDQPFWKDDVVSFLTGDVYVTIDLDVFDPSLMPAVGTPEPGGMGWYTLLELLSAVVKKKNVVGFDVVELCPIDGQVMPDFVAAKLIYRFLGYIFSNKK